MEISLSLNYLNTFNQYSNEVDILCQQYSKYLAFIKWYKRQTCLRNVRAANFSWIDLTSVWSTTLLSLATLSKT